MPVPPRMSPSEASKILAKIEQKRDKGRYSKDGKRVATVANLPIAFPGQKCSKFIEEHTYCRLAHGHGGRCSSLLCSNSTSCVLARNHEGDCSGDELMLIEEYEPPPEPTPEPPEPHPTRHADRLRWRHTTILSSAEAHDMLTLMSKTDTVSEWIRVAVRQRIEREKTPGPFPPQCLFCGKFVSSYNVVPDAICGCEKTPGQSGTSPGPHDRPDCPCGHPLGEVGVCAGCNCCDEE